MRHTTQCADTPGQKPLRSERTYALSNSIPICDRGPRWHSGLGAGLQIGKSESQLLLLDFSLT